MNGQEYYELTNLHPDQPWQSLSATDQRRWNDQADLIESERKLIESRQQADNADDPEYLAGLLVEALERIRRIETMVELMLLEDVDSVRDDGEASFTK